MVANSIWKYDIQD